MLFCNCSYYPVFPPPPGALLDTSLATRSLTMDVTPDVLVVPSDLAAFAKLLPLRSTPPAPAASSAVHTAAASGVELKSPEVAPAASPGSSLPVHGSDAADGSAAVVVVNPGRLAKGVTGGSYAQLSIAAAPAAVAALQGDPPQTNAASAHDVSSRCRVDIIRI